MTLSDLYPDVKGKQEKKPHSPHHRPVPYAKNLTLSIHEVAPADPYGHGYLPSTDCPAKADRKTLKRYTKLGWCLKNKLAAPSTKKTTATQQQQQHSHRLHIIGQVACGDDRGAQLVRCHLDEDRATTYVAKIYDPLYYAFVDVDMDMEEEKESIPVDVTWLAEHDFRREAAAYTELKKCRQDGRFTPKYFGSWTFTMGNAHDGEGEVEESRPVHMILLEALDGRTMFSLLESKEHLKLYLRLRLDVFARVLEAAAALRFYNVAQDDLAPRNVMLTGLDFVSSPQAVERVVLFDFNEAVVLTHHRCWIIREKTDRSSASPLHRFWDDFPYEFHGWVYPLFRRKNTFRCWLLSRWGNDDEAFGGLTEAEKECRRHDHYEEPPPLQDEELDGEIIEKLNRELGCDWRRFV